MPTSRSCAECGEELSADAQGGLCVKCAQQVLARALERLRSEYSAAGKATLFDELKGFLSNQQPTPHADIAARLGVSVSAVRSAIHRMRQRYGELVREEISQSVSRPEEVDDEESLSA